MLQKRNLLNSKKKIILEIGSQQLKVFNKLSINLSKQIISKNASNLFCPTDFYNKTKVKF